MQSDSSSQPSRAIVVLGNGIIQSDNTLQLPNHLVKRLNEVAEIYLHAPENQKPLIVPAGKWSLWHRKSTPPPITEAEKMRQELLDRGIPSEAVLKEEESEDTIGNAFFVRRLLEGRGLTRITVTCSDYQAERAEYIFRRIFEGICSVDMLISPGPFEGDQLVEQKFRQRSVLEDQKPLIEQLLADPSLLDHLYELPYYTEQLKGEPNEVGVVAMGLHRGPTMLR